jgi:hypothetical protein
MLIKDDPDSAYWTPTQDLILEMEEQLHAHIQEQTPFLATNLSNYKRQYFGFIRDGRKQIFIVGFCEPVSLDWRKELVTSPIAGKCYLEAQYDLEDGQIQYLWQKTER